MSRSRAIRVVIARGAGHESVTELVPCFVLQSQQRHSLGCGAVAHPSNP